MKTVKSLLLLILFFSMISEMKLEAQDVSFSQVYSSPIYLSPSFSGFTSGGRVIINYRDQWPSIPHTFRTYAVSYDQFVDMINSGFGLLFLQDNQGGGQIVTQNAGLNYAYELPITSDIFFRPGLQFKYLGLRTDPGKMIDVDQSGVRNPWKNDADFEVVQHHKLDFTASLMVYSNFFWAGATVDHLVKNNIGFTHNMETYMPVKITVFGGGKWRYIESTRGRSEQSATFAFMFRRQERFQQLDLGVYWNVSPLEAGIWYRGIPGISTGGLSNNDAIIFSLGVSLGRIYVAYSYDLTLSKLAGYSGGSNEFSLIYRFPISGGYTPNRGAVPCGEAFFGLGEPYKYRAKKRSFF